MSLGRHRRAVAGLPVLEFAAVAPGLGSIKDQPFTLSVVGTIVNFDQAVVVFGRVGIGPEGLDQFTGFDQPAVPEGIDQGDVGG